MVKVGAYFYLRVLPKICFYLRKIFKDFMEQINKIDIAKDIVERLIVQEIRNGYDSTNPFLTALVQMKEEILKNNEAVIDEVLENYKSALKGEN